MNSRYYDPETGRFISPDAVLGANGDLLSYNRYLYCSNNPVMYADPSGEGILLTIFVCGLISAATSVGTIYVNDVVNNYQSGMRGADMWTQLSSPGTYLGAAIGGFYAGALSGGLGAVGITGVMAVGFDAVIGGAGSVLSGFTAALIDGNNYSTHDAIGDAFWGSLSSLVVSGTYHGIGKARTHSFNRKSGRVQKDMMPDIFNTTKHRGTQIFHTGAFRQSEQFINYMYRGATGISTTIGMIADFAILRIRVVE